MPAISSPGSTLEDLENDLAALDMLDDALRFALDEGADRWKPGMNRGDPKAVLAWLREKIAETENSIDALSGLGMPDPDQLPLPLEPTRIPCARCGIPIPDPGEIPDPAALLCDKCDSTDETPGR